jgi:hypothetical protein
MKKIFFFLIFFCVLFNVKIYSQITITSPSNVNLGTFVAGSTGNIDAPFNELVFQITSPKDTIYSIIIENQSSKINENNANISTKWLVSGNIVGGNVQPNYSDFQSGTIYQFRQIMYIKVIVNNAQIYSSAVSGDRVFIQELIVETVN